MCLQCIDHSIWRYQKYINFKNIKTDVKCQFKVILIFLWFRRERIFVYQLNGQALSKTKI